MRGSHARLGNVQGVLHKKGAHLPTWRRRVFVLRNGLLLWFRDEADAAARAASGGGSGRGPRGAFALAGFAAAREAPEVTKVSRSAAAGFCSSCDQTRTITQALCGIWIFSVMNPNKVGKCCLPAKELTCTHTRASDSYRMLPTNVAAFEALPVRHPAGCGR